MKFSVVIALVWTLWAPASVGFADWHKIEAEEFALPSPPPQETWDAEIASLLERQEMRDQDTCNEARSQRIPSYTSFFDRRRFLSKRQFNKVKPLIEEALHFGERVSTHFKDQHLRLRPYNYDPRVQPCIQPPKANKSYPSSHAALGQLAACLLAIVLPHRADVILEQGQRVGELRLWAGVHFPSDVKAGQDLANDICERLQEEDDFKAELMQLQQELSAPPDVRTASDVRLEAH
ncbi:MAG: phosphatase PAP2 family protein [Bdellovibrionales bacterium]